MQYIVGSLYFIIGKIGKMFMRYKQQKLKARYFILIKSYTKTFSSPLVISLVLMNYMQKDRDKNWTTKYNDYVE